MTFPDYREILDRMASLNGRWLTAPLPSHRLEITSHSYRFAAWEATWLLRPTRSLVFLWLLVFMFRIDDRRSRLTQAVCISFRPAHDPAPPHKFRSVDPLLPLLLHPPVQLLRRQ
jgi:hypothetical protein